MIIGVPKEIKQDEHRIGMVPSTVKMLALAGHTLLIETGAGDGSGFSDSDFIGAGGAIIDSAEEVWSRAEMVVKVKEPIEPEYRYLREGLILYTFLHLAADKQLTEELIKSGTIALGYETVEEKNGSLPLLLPMSEVAGRMSVQEGAKYLEKEKGGKGILLGGVPGVPPGKIVILGGGVVGSNAAKIAVGIGASVSIIDSSLPRLRYLEDIFGNSIETLHSNPATIRERALKADLLIGAVLIPGAKAPKLVSRSLVSEMQPGSVIVDVAVDQGGAVETSRPTTHHDPTFTVDGVTHYCVANMPGAVPRTSTMALSNATSRYCMEIANLGIKEAIKAHPALRPGINTWLGDLTCEEVAKAHSLPYKPLEI